MLHSVDWLSSLQYKVLRRTTDLENVRFEMEDEEEGAQFAHPVRDEIVRGESCYYYCCHLLVCLCLFGVHEGNSRNESGRPGAGDSTWKKFKEAGVDGSSVSPLSL